MKNIMREGKLLRVGIDKKRDKIRAAAMEETHRVVKNQN